MLGCQPCCPGSGTGCSDSVGPPGGSHGQLNITGPGAGSGDPSVAVLAQVVFCWSVGWDLALPLTPRLVMFWKATPSAVDSQNLGARRRE